MSSIFRDSKESHYKNFLNSNKIEIPENSCRQVSSNDLYRRSKNEGNKANQNILFNSSFDRNENNLGNYFNSSQEFKPKSALKTTAKINRSRLK